MPGTEINYPGVEGHGAAWVGKPSSFDPVAFAKGAFDYGKAKQKIDAAANQKQLDALMKDVGTNNMKLLDTDYFNSVRKHHDNFWSRVSNLNRQNQGLDQADMLEIASWKDQMKGLEKTYGYQRDLHNNYINSFSRDDGTMNIKSMKKRDLVYLRPDMADNIYSDNPLVATQINNTFQPILDSYLNNKQYQLDGGVDTEWATQDAIMEWRQKYGHAVLQPVLSPVSLNEDFKKNVGPLAGQYMTSQKSGGKFGSEVSQLVKITSADDKPVKLPDGTETTVRGIRTAAGVNYNGNPRIRESALENFVELQDSDTRDRYLKEAGGDPKKASFDWYVDNMGKLGESIEIKETYKPSKQNFYNGIGTNEGITTTNWNGELNLNYIGISDPNSETPNFIDAYKKTDVNGIKLSKNGDQPIRLFVSPNTVYDQNLVSWKGSNTEGSGNYYLDLNSTFVAPVLASSINLNDPKFKNLKIAIAKEVGADKVTEMMRLYKQNGGQVDGGIILSNNEVNLIKQIPGGKDLIAERGFVGGSMTTQDENMTRQGTMKRSAYKLPGAIIPTDEVKEDYLEAVGSYPDDMLTAGNKWSGKYKRYGDTGEQGGDKTTPNGVAYANEDEDGYYDANWSLVEPK